MEDALISDDANALSAVSVNPSLKDCSGQPNEKKKRVNCGAGSRASNSRSHNTNSTDTLNVEDFAIDSLRGAKRKHQFVAGGGGAPGQLFCFERKRGGGSRASRQMESGAGAWKRADQEREVVLRSKKEGGAGQDFLGLLAMLLSVSAMFFRIKAFAFAGVVLHLSSYAQMRISDRSLSTLLTNVGVAIMAIFMVHANSALVPNK